MAKASCGRTWLYSSRNLSIARCCALRLAAAGIAVSCFSVRCIRSCLPFCSGCPASIRSTTIPSFIHHTASRDNPAIAREANGAPLSVRIVSGRPYSRNAASKIACTRAVSVFSTAWQRSRYRLCASVMVNGSILSPSPVRNQPLKSAHHTRFGPFACANGSVYGATRRRFRRVTTSPSRFNSAPIVLAAGHFLPGSSRSNTRFNFRGPQLMCAPRRSSTISSIFFGVWLSCRRGARLCSKSPSQLLALYRRNHTYPVSREISYLRHSSLIVRWPCSYSNTNRSFSSITLLFFHGMRSVLLAPAIVRSVRYPPGLFCQGSARSVPSARHPPPIDVSLKTKAKPQFERPVESLSPPLFRVFVTANHICLGFVSVSRFRLYQLPTCSPKNT